MGAIQKTAIVIPCFNEARRLKPETFFDYLDKNEGIFFYFVNDGSNDRTEVILEDMCARAPDRLYWKSLDQNKGKAEAVREGILTAMEQDFDAIGYLDADLSAPLECINDLLKCLQDPNIRLAMGSRVLLLGRRIKRKAVRHYLGRAFATAASLVLGMAVYDTQCGAKIFKTDATSKQLFSDPFFTRWIFDVELLVKMMALHRYSGLPALDRCVLEYPLKQWENAGGSKLKISDYAVACIDLLKISMFRFVPGLIPQFKSIHARYQGAGRHEHH